MENKKNLPMRIVNLILLLGALVVDIILMTLLPKAELKTIAESLTPISVLINIMALAIGIVYIVAGYTKSSAAFYKAFVWTVVFSQVIDCSSPMVFGTGSLVESDKLSTVLAFAYLCNLVFFAILAIGKDLGKEATFTIAGLMVVISLLVLFIFIFTKQSSMTLIYKSISQTLIALTIAIMVVGKYLDKAARGRE